MKIESVKTKKCLTEVPADCKALIDKLQNCDNNELLDLLYSIKTWTVGKCELYHWVEVLNRFDTILQSASAAINSEWCLAVNSDENLQNLTLSVLHFTSLLIEYSFSRHLYNSMEHLVALLSSSDLDVILSVLNLLYVFSKRSNFLSRLSDKQRLPLLKKLGYLAENWGGKENGFGLADAASDHPRSFYPRNSTTLHYEFYAEQAASKDSQQSDSDTHSMVYCIHIENVDEIQSNPAEIMDSLLQLYPVPEEKRMLLYTHLRLAYSFSRRDLRLKCVQARLHAISVLVYMNSLQNVSNNLSNILYTGFIEELVDLLQVPDTYIVDIKAAALRTLTSIVHLECRVQTPRVSTVVDATGVAQYHGFLPVLVRRCIQSMTSKDRKEDQDEFAPNFTTALFSFLYHLSSYESGGEALVQSGMMGPLLNVVITMGDQQDQTTFVTRAVRVIDLITNVDWQAFQRLGGLRIFIDRLEHEVTLCEKDTPPNSNQKGVQCLPQRAALFKSILNFLKKAMSDHVFGEEVRHIMDGSLPTSLKHIINNVEYYGPSLFLLAMEVVTVYVFQEPSLLSVLQDNSVTDAMLNALLLKDPPATREVLASLPNIFSALCLNSRGLEAFVRRNPFDRLFKVMLSPSYLLAMRIRRGSGPMGNLDRDTASNLGNAMDELMRHQPTLRSDAMKAIIQLLHELKNMGSDPSSVCTKLPLNKPESSGSSGQESMIVIVGDDTGARLKVLPGGGPFDSQVPRMPDGIAAIRFNLYVQLTFFQESEDEDATASHKPTALSQTYDASSDSKNPVPLLDYIHNVMKFIQAIVSNNATDDHCQEFQNHDGLPVLFSLLHLPVLPVDFPTTPSCQAVAGLVKSILTLSRKSQVFTEGLKHFKMILSELEPVYEQTSGRNEEIWSRCSDSVLLYELASAQSGSEPTDIALIRSLVHAHAFVAVFLQVCRTSQTDIRDILITQWATEAGLDVLSRLNKLYCSLIWESTMVLSVCTPGTNVDGTAATDSDDKEKLYKILLSKYNKTMKQTKETEGKAKAGNASTSEVMEEDGKGSNAAWTGYMKIIRPVLAVSSKLGRSLAELFGLLVKLSIGLPLRQRYRHTANVQPSPTKAACCVAEKLSDLLRMGLTWSLPQQLTSHKFKITFFTCTIGFTMGMLFDERKLSYHVMLQYFQKSGALNAFFDSFNWALSIQDHDSPVSEFTPELAGNLDALCETWLMVLERLVNVKNIIDSPHMIMDKSAQLKSSETKPFDPVMFLLETHKAALNTLKRLWSSDKLHTLSVRTCESVLTIICYLIHGEKSIKRKISKRQAPSGDSTLEASNSSAIRTLTASTTNESMSAEPAFESQVYQQLVDMGFSRQSVMEALLHTQTLHAATDWILSHPQPSEEVQLLQAITMSLECNPVQETVKKEEPISLSSTSTEDTEKEETERYLSGEEIDSFISGLLDGCLRLLDHFPDSVYRVYEVFEEVMKRNGIEWCKEKKIFEKIITEVRESCDFLLKKCDSVLGPDSAKVMEWLCEQTNSKKLSTRCVLLSLLFQGRQFSDVCMDSLKEGEIIQKLVELIAAGCSCMAACNYRSVPTPEWVASVLLLLDLYDRAYVYKCRISAISPLKSLSRVWKWFDDRSARWCNYSASNQKILDDAYMEGVSKIQFTAGRRRYNVNFLQMVQVNEESGNRRPIMVVYNKPKSRAAVSSTKEDTSITEEETSMDTDTTEGKPAEATTEWNGITQDQAHTIILSCAGMLLIPANPDALHAIMRLLLRLTRSDRPGGYENAMEFMKLGGTQFLLELKKESEFDGFMSLATLIFCHVLEDGDTLQYVMEKTIRTAARQGVPNQSSGVSASTIGNREMYYVLQALAPMACRHPTIFASACKNHLRICMPSIKHSHVYEEETRMMNGSTAQILEPIKDSATTSAPKPHLNSTTKRILQLLLNYLVSVDHVKRTNQNTDEKLQSKSTSSVITVAQQLRQVADDMHRRYSESEAVDHREEERVAALRQSSVLGPVTEMEEGSSQNTQELEEVFDSSSVEDDGNEKNESQEVKKKKEKGKTKTSSDQSTRLFSKAAILRLLAELVSSYPVCASFLVNYTYTPSPTSVVKQESSCISYILHNLLPPSSSSNGGKSESSDGLNNNNSKNRSTKDCCSSLARVLLTSIVCSHPKTSVQNSVINEVKLSLQKTLALPESLNKHNALRALLGLISNMIECASKLAHIADSSPHGGSEDPMNLARVMINKGLATDLAQIPNYIDLGSPNMAETVNAALKPLEILSRLVHSSSSPNTPKPSGASEKNRENEMDPSGVSTSNAGETTASVMDEGREQTNSDQQPEASGITIASTNEVFEGNTNSSSFNSAAGDNSEYIDDPYLSTDGDNPRFSHDLIMSESTDDHDGGEEDDEEEDCIDMNVEDDHVDDEDQDSSGSEDQTEHNDDQDLDDEGSEMDDLDEDDDNDVVHNPNNLNYETFVYDLLNETSENNILLQLEDVLSDGFVGRLPQPLMAGNARTSQLFAMPVPLGEDASNPLSAMASSWYIPTTHPILTRTGRSTTSIAASVNVTSSSNVLSRSTYANAVSSNQGGRTLQIEFTSNAQEAPHILNRLLGPSATADVLHLSNSLYQEGGGHAQLLLNSNNFRLLQSEQEMNNTTVLENITSLGGARGSGGSLSHLPTALSRWTQSSEVLEPDSTQFCLLGVRQEIIDTLETQRDHDIEERRAKREAEKEKEEQNAKIAKEKAALEHEDKETETEEQAQSSTEVAESNMDSGAAGISTPTNTPIATRPESPVNEQSAPASSDVDAIDALQQASSSLQSVSLESNHEDEDVTNDAETPEDVSMQQGESSPPENEEEITEETEPQDALGESAAEDDQNSGSETTAEAVATSEAGNVREFEGVDPSFLAALPDDIRQEVIREQLSRQGQRHSNASESQPSGVSPEFLAALPPSIQQEVLAQERAEQERVAAQQSSSANEPVDPTTFIQTLPSSLRQSVLADMDDSLVAVLPADLAAEAQELRASMERRQQRYLPERLFSRSVHSNILQHRGINLPSRFRYPTSGMWGAMQNSRNRQQNPTQNLKVQVRQLLNHEPLSCMLLLLFVEEPKLNLTRLHKVLRNLCFHFPTRMWLISTLVAILQHSAQTKFHHKSNENPEEAMDYRTTPSALLKQKPNQKQPNFSLTLVSDRRNTSWLSIRLDAALGSRASIFRVVEPRPAKPVTEPKKETVRRYSPNSNIYIHPQAAPVVCRHTIDTLIMLAKYFPRHFVSTALTPVKGDRAHNKYQKVETDFWNVLLRLDTLVATSDVQKKCNAEDKRVVENTTQDIEATCMGELLRMLAHPVIQRSQQLTDRLLRLLALVSAHLPSQTKAGLLQTQATKGNLGEAMADSDASSKNKNDPSTNEQSESSTATMGARACTSNTSTIGHSKMDTKTATTGSTQATGSISISAVATECLCSTPLEKELELAVQILTSHACSEDGLEDATTVLIQLSKSQPALRSVIIKLLLHGAQKIGHKLCEQIKTLSKEMEKYAQEDSNLEMKTDRSSVPSTSITTPSSSDYYTLAGKAKLKPTGKELQLPVMQLLTSKTSNQAFFLRILKVIIQLQKAKDDEKKKPESQRARSTHAGHFARMFNYLQLSRDEIEPDSVAEFMSASSSTTQTDSVAPSSKGEMEESATAEDKEDQRSLCEQLQLEELWDVLGQCLKQLEESNDQHAVLVLQPSVEAFFLVHASKPNTAKQSEAQKEGESQLAHLELQPLSPSFSSETSSQPSQTSVSADDNLSKETKKFLEFAETHRSILNQILRQSNVPLTEGPFSVLVDHTKVLDFDVKRQHFRQELERLDDTSMSRRDDIAIRVRRQHVFEDSFRELHRRSPEELKSRLYIVFEGEEGQDAGGLLREWYLIISKEIFNPMYALFRTSPGDRVTYTINPLSYINSNHLSYFKFVGGIVAKAIYDNKLLDCYFTRSFYKHILGKPVKYTDMESEDYAFSQGLIFLLENHVSLLGTELNFSVEIVEFGKTEVRDLKPNGRNAPVTEDNKREYVHLVCQEKMTGAIRQQLSSFLEGFYEIIPKRLISIFDEQELELLISGLPTVDIEDLRNNTEYHKYEVNSLQVQWFWRALRSFDQAERAKFLQFVTGTSKVPLQGFAHLEGMTGTQKFQIHRDSRSTSRLPSAHTCFNQLDLPAYETYDKLRHMLLLAISECQEGFGLA